MNTTASQIEVANAPAARARSLLVAHLRVPLFREGYALVLNSALTSLFGLAYWLLAAHSYTPRALGLNSAAISAMMFLAGVAQLNFASALIRFIPVSGRRSTRFVLSSYLISTTVAAVAALVFLAGLGAWAPDLRFLFSSPGLALWFVAATMAWCVFNLQDGALTSLRAAIFVPLENLGYSMAKIVLLVALAAAAPSLGIFASWTAGLVVSLVPVNILIFARLLPRHERRASDRLRPPTGGQVARFISADYFGSLCWLASAVAMPVIVVALAGPSENAYFSLAWMVALPLYTISASTGASLVVTAAGDEARLATYARQVLVQTAGLVLPLALALALAAPLVLSLFGAEYTDHGAGTLSLLALSAIPAVVNVLYVNVYRVRRRMSAVAIVMGAEAVLVLGVGVVLLQAIGIVGVGLAWVVAQSVLAAAQIAIEPRALWARPGGRAAGSGRATPLMLARNLAADVGALGLLGRLRSAPGARRRSREAGPLTAEVLARIPAGSADERPAGWTRCRSIPTVSDMTVVSVGPPGGRPRAVVKLAASDSARRSLGREREVLGKLHSDERLGDSRRLLPAVLAEGELGGRSYVVQRMLEGVQASSLLADARAARTVQAAAAQAIGDFHMRTLVPATVDESLLERWVDRPLLAVRRASTRARVDNSRSAVLDRLQAELYEALRGQALALSWVHGDFVPGNVLSTPDGAEVVGIVDWELAGARELPLIDVMTLLLSMRAQGQRQELGQVVRALLAEAVWTGAERDLLAGASARLPGAEKVGWRTLAMLCWLRHVASNLTKSGRYGGHRLWLRMNVRAVLDTLGGAGAR